MLYLNTNPELQGMNINELMTNLFTERDMT
jgi:hypothetical protein